MKKRKIESIILISIVVIVILACIIIGVFNNPLIKRNQTKIDNLKNAKSIDVYVINNAFEFKENEHYVTNIKGNSIKNILNIISNSKASVSTSFGLYGIEDDNTYLIMNSYYLELKDDKNEVIGKYHIYIDNHLMLDEYVVTLSNQKYNELTTELMNIISKDTGTLNCKNGNEEDTFFLVKSQINNYRNILYESKDNYETEKRVFKEYKNRYEGFDIGLITSQKGVISGVYPFEIDENTMILVKTYDFDILSEEDTRKSLNISKDDFINRTIEDIKKEYPQDACEYQLW